MPVSGLTRSEPGVGQVSRSVDDPRWEDFGQIVKFEGDEAVTVAVRAYLQGDINTVTAQGSYNTSAFSLSGANESIVITATPLSSVDEPTSHAITMRATGITVAGTTPTPVDNTLTLTTLPKKNEVFWTGVPGRSVNENTTATIGLSQYIGSITNGVRDETGDFDSISLVSTSPSVDYITVENGNTTMAQLQIVAPDVSVNTHISAKLRVTRAEADPTTADVDVIISVLALVEEAGQGINVRFDMPDGPITAGTFTITAIFSSAPEEGDTVLPTDFIIDGRSGVSVTSATVDPNDDKRYTLACTAENDIEGVFTITMRRS